MAEKLSDEDKDKIIQLADALIEGLSKPGYIGDPPERCVTYCDNAIAKLRLIKRVGIARRIIELEHLKKRYATAVA